MTPGAFDLGPCECCGCCDLSSSTYDLLHVTLPSGFPASCPCFPVFNGGTFALPRNGADPVLWRAGGICADATWSIVLECLDGRFHIVFQWVPAVAFSYLFESYSNDGGSMTCPPDPLSITFTRFTRTVAAPSSGTWTVCGESVVTATITDVSTFTGSAVVTL